MRSSVEWENIVNSCQISVIIVNYNAGEKLLKCVQSLVDCNLQLEIIVVDNNSSDTSISDVSNEFPHYRQIQLIQNQENLGFATACNIGARAAGGEYLLFLNPDCEIDQSAITKLIRCFEEMPQTGMAGGRILNSDGSEQVGCRRLIPTPWRALLRVCHLSFLARVFPRYFENFNLNQQEVPDGPVEVEAISGACMLVSRESFADVGGMDEEYFLHCEDLDWCMSFRNRGWKIMFVPDARLAHFQGTCSKSRPIFVEWHKHHGMVRFYRKHFTGQYPAVLMWLVMASVWLRFSLLCCFYSCRKLLSREKTASVPSEVQFQEGRSPDEYVQQKIAG